MQVYPHALEAEYARDLVAIVHAARSAYAEVVRDAPKLVEQASAERGDSLRFDKNEGEKARAMVARASKRLEQRIRPVELEALAEKYARATERHQKEQIARQARAAIGVDPVFRDSRLAGRIDDFVHENVALIGKIQRNLHSEVETLVTRAVSSGRSSEDLADELTERFGVAERHARLIARDQIGKLTGRINADRQRELGVKSFTWRTVGDERVRDEHVELDGQEFAFSDPPSEGLPGEPVCCRCSAEPIFNDATDDGEDDAA